MSHPRPRAKHAMIVMISQSRWHKYPLNSKMPQGYSWLPASKAMIKHEMTYLLVQVLIFLFYFENDPLWHSDIKNARYFDSKFIVRSILFCLCFDQLSLKIFDMMLVHIKRWSAMFWHRSDSAVRVILWLISYKLMVFSLWFHF